MPFVKLSRVRGCAACGASRCAACAEGQAAGVDYVLVPAKRFSGAGMQSWCQECIRTCLLELQDSVPRSPPSSAPPREPLFLQSNVRTQCSASSVAAGPARWAATRRTRRARPLVLGNAIAQPGGARYDTLQGCARSSGRRASVWTDGGGARRLAERAVVLQGGRPGARDYVTCAGGLPTADGAYVFHATASHPIASDATQDLYTSSRVTTSSYTSVPVHTYQILGGVWIVGVSQWTYSALYPSPDIDDPSHGKAILATSFAILREVGEICSEVPYIKGAAGILLRIMMISDKLSMRNKQKKEALRNIEHISAILLEVSVYASSHAWIIPPDVECILKLWPQELECIAAVLHQFEDHKRSRWKRILKIGSPMTEFRQCNAKLQQLAQCYQTKLLLTLQTNTDMNTQNFLPAQSINTKIPAYPSILYGRDSHLRIILKQLGQKNRLPAYAAIIGPGGIGKTTVALAVLHHPMIIQKFGEHIYFISCEGCLSEVMLVQNIAKVLGVGNILDGGLDLLKDSVLSYLRSSSDMLLCLDNFETLWNTDSSVKGMIEQFINDIKSITYVSLLITMRGQRYPEVITWSQPLLPPLEPFPIDIAQKLFQQISNKWDEWAEKLVACVDGLPLAITIIANLAQSFQCKVLWEQWEKVNIEILERGKGHRLTSLEASIHLSIEGHQLRSKPGVLLMLGLLGTLPGGLTLKRIQQLQSTFTEINNIESGVKPLLDSGLGHLTFDGLHAHPLIQYYCQKHLPLSASQMKLLERHYVELNLKESDDGSEICLERLLESTNTGYILLKSVKEHCPSGDTLRAIMSHSWLASIETGSFTEELFLSLQQYDKHLPMESITRYWLQWGSCLKNTGNYIEAEVKYQKALAYAELHEDQLCQAQVLMFLGMLSSSISEHQECAKYMQSALIQYEKCQDIHGQARVLCQMSKICLVQDLYLDAKAYALKSIELFESINEQYCIGDAWISMGDWFVSECKLDDARECYEKALSIFRKANSRGDQSGALEEIGNSYIIEGNYEVAKDYYYKALALRKQIHGLRRNPEILLSVGGVHIALEEYDTALKFYHQAVLINRINHDSVKEGYSLRGIGHAYFNRGMHSDAINYLEQAIVVHEKCNEKQFLAEDFSMLGKLYYDVDNYELAEEYWMKELRIWEKYNNTESVAYTTMCLGWIYLEDWQPQVAETYFLKALSFCEKSNFLNTHSRVLQSLGDLCRKSGNAILAAGWYRKALVILEGTMNPTATEYLTNALTELKHNN
ncbi:TPR-like protein [Auriscalpium vulgare]|uniref:TPR-like protein n=1 Tax=Auriscalpium vulgare TaxID=40419 RepID=A0ACB8R7K8_9AGAM|nr:TPR-like protein [Auriscalpium vulgare]